MNAHSFHIPVGALQLTVHGKNARVPALLWGNLAFAAVLEHAGYDKVARAEIGKLEAFIRRDSQERTWYLLRVMAQQERMLLRALEEKGVRAYVPLRVSKPPVAQHGRRRRPRANRTRPLIPGYIFVSLPDDEAIDTARNLHGVIEIMCRDGKPRRVPAMAIGCMIFHEACHDFDEAWTPPPIKGKRYSHAWKPGNVVRIEDGGAFHGFMAEVKGPNNRDFMDVLVTIFGRPTEVTIEHRHLVKPDVAPEA